MRTCAGQLARRNGASRIASRRRSARPHEQSVGQGSTAGHTRRRDCGAGADRHRTFDRVPCRRRVPPERRKSLEQDRQNRPIPRIGVGGQGRDRAGDLPLFKQAGRRSQQPCNVLTCGFIDTIPPWDTLGLGRQQVSPQCHHRKIICGLASRRTDRGYGQISGSAPASSHHPLLMRCPNSCLERPGACPRESASERQVRS